MGMNTMQVAHYASSRHGMSASTHIGGKDHFDYRAEEIAAMTPGQLGETLTYMVNLGYIELRTRTVDLKAQPHDHIWPEMHPVGKTTIRTWYLTESGREAWLANDM